MSTAGPSRTRREIILPSDVWICCHCAASARSEHLMPLSPVNLFTLAGDDCPLCAHRRCQCCTPSKDTAREDLRVILPDWHAFTLRDPHCTTEADRRWFLDRFARHYHFRADTPFADVRIAYRVWEWLQYYAGRSFPKHSTQDEWTLAPLRGCWQCCMCATFNPPEGVVEGWTAAQRAECVKRDHYRCRLCYIQPVEGMPLAGLR